MKRRHFLALAAAAAIAPIKALASFVSYSPGVIDAALFEWSSEMPTPPLWPLVEAGLDLLAPILD